MTKTLFKQTNDSTIRHQILKQVQDDVMVGRGRTLAFTLAEVLIVIGIIGVVAALTLPNLNHATGDKERITKVKKIYSALTEAYDRAQVVYGDYSESWFNGLTTQNDCKERFAKRIIEFMKISKDCGFSTDSGCMTSGTVKLVNGGGGYFAPNGNSYYKVVTADGMSIAFGVYYFNGSIGDYIFVDIDGPNKGEFTHGKDVFQFNVQEGFSDILPNGGPAGGFLYGGMNAARWIIENDNADYLKADSTGKCNDSNIILDGVTNTSCH